MVKFGFSQSLEMKLSILDKNSIILAESFFNKAYSHGKLKSNWVVSKDALHNSEWTCC